MVENRNTSLRRETLEAIINFDESNLIEVYYELLEVKSVKARSSKGLRSLTIFDREGNLLKEKVEDLIMWLSTL